MKKLLLSGLTVAGLALAFAFTLPNQNAAIVSSETSVEAVGYFDIYVENKCSHDVKLKIRASGSSSTGTLYAGKKERKPVQEGYEIYCDGKLIKKIEAGDKGETIVVCD